MLFVLGVVLFALGITVSIALHEAGHMVTAKAFGMRVRRYFIGFGPRIFSFRRGETEYGLKVIPAGGFCDIAGMTALDEVTPEEAPRAFFRKPTWQRVVVLSAGSVTHFLIGIVLVYALAVTAGLPNLRNTPVVGELSCAADQVSPTALADCTPNLPQPALTAGLRPGDRLVSVAGTPTPTWPDAVTAIRAATGPTPMVVDRGGQEVALTVDVARVKRLDPATGAPVSVGAIGAGQQTVFSYGPLTAVPATADFTGQMFLNVGQGILSFPQRIPALWQALDGGQRDQNTPVSVVGASIIGGDAAEHGLWQYFILLLALLNFFVGVFNLLPLLPLDGGHIAVNLYERIRDIVRARLGKPKMPPVDYTRLLPLTYLVILVGGAVSLLTLAADIVNPIRLGVTADRNGQRALAVFDIDGVLADVRHRLHHLQTRPQRWEAFFLAADHDPLLAEGAERLRSAQTEHEVVYLTGRPERNRRLTRGWLARHGLPTGPLHMRPDRDHRPARWVKRETLRELARTREIASVLDDDPAVVAVLAADGWPVELATWLPHSSTLQSAQEQQGRT